MRVCSEEHTAHDYSQDQRLMQDFFTEGGNYSVLIALLVCQQS